MYGTNKEREDYMSEGVTNIETQALALPEQAKLVTIVDYDTMESANQLVKLITATIKGIDATFKPMAVKADEAHKEVVAKWNGFKVPLVNARESLVSMGKAFMRKAEEEAEAERRRLAKIAREEEEERRLADALEAEREGKVEEAKAILEEPVFVPVPVVKADIPKVDNRTYATRWAWRVTDIDKVPSEYTKKIVDDAKVNGAVRSTKGDTKIDGIEVYPI